MPDMIPASKVAAAALAQVKQAAACAPENRYSDDKTAQQKVHLQVAAELLALIAEPPQMGHLAEDGAFTPIPTPPSNRPGASDT